MAALVLAFFLLEMGLIASGQLASLKRYGFKLALFALLMPFVGALLFLFFGNDRLARRAV